MLACARPANGDMRVSCLQVRIYLVLELLDALVNLLAECNGLGFLEPKAMVARLVADEALVMGAVRRQLPGTFREKPIRHR